MAKSTDGLDDMFHNRPATQKDVDDFVRFKKLTVPKEEVQKALDEGKLKYQYTTFKDYPDHTALFIEGRETSVGYWPGY